MKARELGLALDEEKLPLYLDEVKAQATRQQRALTDEEFAAIVR